MGRAKLQLKLIEHRSSREAVYRNRLRGLKKKIWELSTLCDVPAMLISLDSCGKRYHWPENQEEVHGILNKYRMNSKKVSNTNVMDSENFILSEIKKKEAELNRIVMENHLLENKAIDFIDSKLGEVEGRIVLLNNEKQPTEVEIPGSCSPSMNFIGDNQAITKSHGFSDQNNTFSDFDGLAGLLDFDGLPDVADFDMLWLDTVIDTRVDNLTLDCEKSRSYPDCKQEYEVNQSVMEPPACESITEFDDCCDKGEDHSNLCSELFDPIDVADFDMLWLDTVNDTRVDNLTLDCEKTRNYPNYEQEYEVNQSVKEPPACESITEFDDCCEKVKKVAVEEWCLTWSMWSLQFGSILYGDLPVFCSVWFYQF